MKNRNIKKTVNFVLCLITLTVLTFGTGCNKNRLDSSPTTSDESIKIGEVNFQVNSIKSLSEVENQLKTYYELKNDPAAKPIWTKIKEWVKAHIGTHLFNNCNGSNPCGPCPGICIPLGRTATITNNNTYNEQDHLSGIGTLGLTRIAEDKFIIEFVNNPEFVIDNTFYVTEDTELSDAVKNAFDTDKFIIKKGAYPLSFSQNPNGETIITVIVE
jgi:hypothetical protein